jgi:hypothetical protein
MTRVYYTGVGAETQQYFTEQEFRDTILSTGIFDVADINGASIEILVEMTGAVLLD